MEFKDDLSLEHGRLLVASHHTADKIEQTVQGSPYTFNISRSIDTPPGEPTRLGLPETLGLIAAALANVLDANIEGATRKQRLKAETSVKILACLACLGLEASILNDSTESPGNDILTLENQCLGIEPPNSSNSA